MKIANKNSALGLVTPPVAMRPVMLAWALALGCGGDTGSGSGSSDAQPTGEGEAAAPAPEQAAPADATPALDPALLPEGVTEAMVEEGRTLFTGGGICYTCHMADGTGGPLAPDLTDDAWINVDGEYASIVELVKTGVSQPVEHPGAMLPRAGMALSDEQVDAVAAYTYMLSRM